MKTKRHKIILHTECMVTNTKNLLEVIRKHYNYIKSNIQNNFFFTNSANKHPHLLFTL